MRRFFILISAGIIVWWIVNCIVGLFFANMTQEQLQIIVVILIILFSAVAVWTVRKNI